MMELYDLVAGYRDWLRYFTRKEFSPHFHEYKEAGEPVIAALDDPAAAAAELLERLEKDWASAGRNRKIKLARENDKMFICMFFNPMAMDVASPNGKILADELCRLYGERYPKEKYQVGTYELYMEGFKPTLFGMKIGK